MNGGSKLVFNLRNHDDDFTFFIIEFKNIEAEKIQTVVNIYFSIR